MEAEDGSELCFPQLQNTSCRKPAVLWHEAVLPFFLMSLSTLTVALNLLVIIAISYFRQSLHSQQNLQLKFLKD